MKVALCLLTLLAPFALAADESPGVYVILDGSGSMWGQLSDGTHKITAAREVLAGFTAERFAGREVALRVYGHRRKGDCDDTELVVTFKEPRAALAEMASFVEGVNPKGKTPISRSLRAALEDFGDRPGEIILVSDGIETCDEDPCELVRAWRESNVAIRVHVVGLGLQEQERQALECISEASGTTYLDAQSVDELAAGFEQIREQRAWRGMEIVATNAAGESLPVEGIASWQGGSTEVDSRGREPVPVGELELRVGVRTKNGNLYRPVTRQVTVAEEGLTRVELVVPEPPSVRARFVEEGTERDGATVYAYVDGVEQFRFRQFDRAYVDPGRYEFRSTINQDNELSVFEGLADGEHKELLFELVSTVQLYLTFFSADSDEQFRANGELWRDGERLYKVHIGNGAKVRPGTYEARLPMKLTPHVVPLVVTAEAEQQHRIVVPVGHVTVRYRNADGSAMDDARIFVERFDPALERWVSDKIKQSGARIPLVPADYRVKGWRKRGDFDVLSFTIAAGDEKELILQAK